LVYTALTMSITTGNAFDGALLMVAFGLGTLPNLLAMGLFADLMRRYAQRPLVRRLAGLLVAGFGVYTLIAVARLI
ncbi:MAG TPA: sulfite exporter TauE/SafE family protein, partial [Gammaproteobacteria bacterium]|nr:sulfite exporter TauE/SafE family protein [Gammaproteobacteria bacterium]